ncbi:MAG: hypothetical protein IPG56_15445 [Caulobacteraceae bacterium]|nr:hypothetical protein [Caulobacteraceae bacterium]
MHYAALGVAAVIGFIPDNMAAAAFFLPLALVSLEESFLGRDEQSRAERPDGLVFGVCVFGLCAALALGPLGHTLAAWIVGGLSLAAWTVWGFWRASRSN